MAMSTHETARPSLGRTSTRIALLAPALAIAVALSGCGGGSGAAGGDGDGGQGVGETVDTLSVVTGGASANQMVPYLAETLGYAEEEGLNLSVKSVDANVLNIIVSGQADVGEIGSGTALVPVKDGKDTAIIYALGSGSATGFMAAIDGIDSPDQCTNVATHKAGSSAYSSAASYNEALDAGWAIQEYGTPTDVVASVLSGRNDCAVSSLGILTPGLSEGLHLIIDPDKDPGSVPPGSVQGALGVGLWGMKENLDSKRDAVVKLVKATNRVKEYLASTDPHKVAEALVKHSDFETNDVDRLAANIAAETGLLFPDDGAILADNWPTTLRFYGWGNADIDPDDELWAFERRVDTSYFDAAK